jgi:lipoate-protein ligase A
MCRLILDPPARGTWNMAVDEALLEAAVDVGAATLRLYQWSEPTLSLGYFQRIADRQAHAASNKCAVVRRQSGGGAILHDRELTYSLTLPPRHPLTRDATALYTAVHTAFVQCLSPQLAATRAADWKLVLNTNCPHMAPDEVPFLCFQRRACGDLLLEAKSVAATNFTQETYKILGSAQRRHRGAILQHGSLLIGMSLSAPELPGWQELTSGMLPISELTSGIVRQLADMLPLEANPSQLPVNVYNRAKAMEQDRYLSRSWTARR